MPARIASLYYQSMADRSGTTNRGRYLTMSLAALAAVALFPCAAPADADIYRWEDERGVIHFTDNPSAIPEHLRGKIQPILKEPPIPGKPSLSTVGSPTLPSPGGVNGASAPSNDTSLGDRVTLPVGDDPSRQAESLRAKIDAKERFLEKVDNKRSQILNPLGNRFVSQEDLELYKKYSEELPGDRERLRELESGAPSVR